MSGGSAKDPRKWKGYDQPNGSSHHHPGAAHCGHEGTSTQPQEETQASCSLSPWLFKEVGNLDLPFKKCYKYIPIRKQTLCVWPTKHVCGSSMTHGCQFVMSELEVNLEKLLLQAMTQGCILSPVLFTISIAGLNEDTESIIITETDVRKLGRRADGIKIQSDFYRLYHWTQYAKRKLIREKCKGVCHGSKNFRP